MMATNRRKSPRRVVSRAGLIQSDDGPSRLQRCMMVDVSHGGSQLVLADSAKLPTEFTLILSHGGGVKRRCRLAWQDGNKAGVRFIALEDAG